MKTLLTLFVALIALPQANAASCPNLEGDYECRFNGQSYTARVTQEQVNGAWVYKVIQDGQDLDVVTDGRRRNFDFTSPDADIRNSEYTARCDRNRVIVTAAGDLYNGGRPMGRPSIEMILTQNGHGDFQSQTRITMGGFSLPPEVITCPKI